MRYPTISADELERLAPLLLDDNTADVENAVKWDGTGPEADLSALEQLAGQLKAQLKAFEGGSNAKDRDAFEGQASGQLHAALSHLPIAVLDDPGFWRYVTVKHLWWLVRWRQSETFDAGDFGKYREYIDGRKNTECVTLRMFLRGQIALDDGDYAAAAAVPEAADFWRSHIVRVRTSYSPELARGLVRQQATRRMMTDDLRDYAKKINRMASNVALRSYERDDVDPLLEELRVD